METLSIDLKNLEEASLTNEEILELLAFLSSLESAPLFYEHIRILASKYDPTLEMRPLEIEVLSLRERFPLLALQQFYFALNHTYDTLVLGLIQGYQEDIWAGAYLKKLEEIFGTTPSASLIKGLVDYMETSQMNGRGITLIRNHLLAQLPRVQPYAPIPSYIKDFQIEVNTLPHLTETPVNEDLPPELLAEYVYQNRGFMDLQVDEEEDHTAIKEILARQIEELDPTQRRDLTRKFSQDPREILDLRRNKNIFRVYGPVNAFLDTDWSILTTEEGEPDVNKIFGGARMFTDLSLEGDYENDLPAEDWFLGYCQQCYLRIRAYHHAVREPYLTGGWKGCYCSWNCVREAIEQIKDEGTDQTTVAMARLGVVSLVERDMQEYGIQDRDYQEPEEEMVEPKVEEIENLKAKLPVIEPVVPEVGTPTPDLEER